MEIFCQVFFYLCVVRQNVPSIFRNADRVHFREGGKVCQRNSLVIRQGTFRGVGVEMFGSKKSVTGSKLFCLVNAQIMF